jgi:D-methionine transport system ATP-binding protein
VGEDRLVAEHLSLARGGGRDPDAERRPVLQDVSFRVRGGEIFGVIGPSGAGKTTLLRLLNGLESPDRGRILVDGVDAAVMDVVTLRRRVGMVFQAPALFPGRVSTNICYPLAIQGVPVDEQEHRGRAALERVGLLADLWDRGAEELSQGERQRVSIARALVSEPAVLLMDEPTSALDPAASSRILSIVRSLNSDVGVTIVFVTHLMHQARDLCHRALVLIDGQSVEQGQIPALLDAPSSELARSFLGGEWEPSGGAGEGPGSGSRGRGKGSL